MSMDRDADGRAATAVAGFVILAAVGAMLYLSSCGGGEPAETASAGASAGAVRGEAGSPSPYGDCSTVESSLAAVQSALSAAEPGATVCVSDGSYGRLSLDETKAAPGVTVRAEHPGKARIAGAVLQGSELTIARFDVSDEVSVEPGSTGMTIDHNRISGGYFGVIAGPTTSTDVTDVTITGNQFVGPFGEDAIRLNRYHDGPDANRYGILIEGNEITGVRENGSHSDCLQSNWGGDNLYFKRNYVHDDRCQGFFIKDQPEAIRNIVFDDNLMLRNAAPCDPPGSSCGPPVTVQIFGPTDGVSVTHNTIWTSADLSPFTLREGPFGKVTIADNAIFRGWSDWKGGFPEYTEKSNTVCRWESTMPPLSASSRQDCSPPFADPARDDYRLPSGDGVDWRPADQHYGP